MLHWLHSLLPHIPHYGYVLVFIVAFLNNLGVPLPGETILLGAGFVLGKTADSLWQPVVAGTAACFLGGICAFWLGRRLGQGNLEKIRWLHLTPERLKWPERFFKRHGAKTVFIARFIFLFPPVVVNLLAGMSKMPWRTFLFYNLMGSAAYATTYTLIGYFFGKKWKQLEAWLGPVPLYLIFAGVILVVLGVIFRHSAVASNRLRSFDALVASELRRWDSMSGRNHQQLKSLFCITPQPDRQPIAAVQQRNFKWRGAARTSVVSSTGRWRLQSSSACRSGRRYLLGRPNQRSRRDRWRLDLAHQLGRLAGVVPAPIALSRFACASVT